MIKVFIVVKDETDYDGDRTYPRVFTDYDEAKTWMEWQKEKHEDWLNSMEEIGERVNRSWTPAYHIEDSQLSDNT